MMRDEFVSIISGEAKSYRNEMLEQALTKYEDRPITINMIREMLMPYCERIAKRMPPDFTSSYCNGLLENFVPRAIKQVRLDAHMNSVHGGDPNLDVFWVDAILVAFANQVCASQCIDLGMYTCDLPI